MKVTEQPPRVAGGQEGKQRKWGGSGRGFGKDREITNIPGDQDESGATAGGSANRGASALPNIYLLTCGPPSSSLLRCRRGQEETPPAGAPRRTPHCPPRACAPLPGPGPHRGWRDAPDGDPEPTRGSLAGDTRPHPRPDLPGEGPMGGGQRDAWPGCGQEKLQPLGGGGGQSPPAPALPGLAAPHARSEADGTAGGTPGRPEGGMGVPGPLQPGRTETGLGWPQEFWGGGCSASSQPRGGLAPRGDGSPVRPRPRKPRALSQRSVPALLVLKTLPASPGRGCSDPARSCRGVSRGSLVGADGGVEGLQGPLPSPGTLAGCVALKPCTALNSSSTSPSLSAILAQEIWGFLHL